MRNIIWIVALFILLVLQAGVFAPLGAGGVNLLLVMVTLAVIMQGFEQGLVIALICGLLLDLAGSAPIGMISMSVLFLFLILHLLLNKFLSRDPNRFILFAAVGLGTVMYFLAVLGWNWIFSLFYLMERYDSFEVISRQLPLTLVLNLIFTYPLLYYYFSIQKIISKLPLHADDEPIRA